MKKKLETIRNALPDLVEIYACTIDEKIITIKIVKQSLVQAISDGYALMDKVHEWFESLAIKNQPIYPLREQLQVLPDESRECINHT